MTKQILHNFSILWIIIQTNFLKEELFIILINYEEQNMP